MSVSSKVLERSGVRKKHADKQALGKLQVGSLLSLYSTHLHASLQGLMLGT